MAIVGIGEMVPSETIEEMNEYLITYGIHKFNSLIYNGGFGGVAYAYIYPHDNMRETKNFEIIQRAFISAYCYP